MQKKQRSKWLLGIGLIIGIIVLLIGYISYKQTGIIDLKQIGALLLGGITLTGILATSVFSSKGTVDISKMKELQQLQGAQISGIKSELGELKGDVDNVVITIREKDLSDAEKHLKSMNGIREIREIMAHGEEITGLCQSIENETSKIFDRSADINVMLKNYIIEVNDGISEIIQKQYSYDFDHFDTKYFRSKLLNKIDHLYESVDFKMLDKNIFEQIHDKITRNIKSYVNEFKYTKDMVNGKRRQAFKKLTLDLTKQITNHSIDIYKQAV